MSPFQDHPSVGQLSDKLLENHIYSVFAVEKQQYQWYEVMLPCTDPLGKTNMPVRVGTPEDGDRTPALTRRARVSGILQKFLRRCRFKRLCFCLLSLQELVRLLPAAYLGKLGLFQAPSLIELVVDAYKVAAVKAHLHP